MCKPLCHRLLTSLELDELSVCCLEGIEDGHRKVFEIDLYPEGRVETTEAVVRDVIRLNILLPDATGA